MMVAIMEGKWQNVQMTADYKVGETFNFSAPSKETLMIIVRDATTQPP